MNSALGTIGLGDNHMFLNTHFAVILGLTYGFLPFMILPLYASIERMDKSLVEASYDLGHGKTSTFLRVILPTVSPGSSPACCSCSSPRSATSSRPSCSAA